MSAKEPESVGPLVGIITKLGKKALSKSASKVAKTLISESVSTAVGSPGLSSLAASLELGEMFSFIDLLFLG